jgi:hypothetical protein
MKKVVDLDWSLNPIGQKYSPTGSGPGKLVGKERMLLFF